MRLTVLTAALCAVAVAACASPVERAVRRGEATLVTKGEHFDTSRGRVFVICAQDEFKLIRCIPEGPIAGCYEDVFTIPLDDVDWSTWVDVKSIPGLRVAFLSPTTVAVTSDHGPTAVSGE